MDDIENPDASLPPPRTARFGEGAEGKGARRARGNAPRVLAFGSRGQEHQNNHAHRGHLFRGLFVSGRSNLGIFVGATQPFA